MRWSNRESVKDPWALTLLTFSIRDWTRSSKGGEESAETIIAAKNDDRTALGKEGADLLYHLVVLLVERGVSLEEVGDELVSRRKEKSRSYRTSRTYTR